MKEATAAGFEHVNLDLIYGTPGESLEDWRTSLESALSADPDHVSAYALIVEDGTQLARRVRRGELPMPDDDDLADKYVLADDLLSQAGLELVRGLQLGPHRRTPAAATTSSTGAATPGGGSARARTATSAASAGGTSSTPPRTPNA